MAHPVSRAPATHRHHHQRPRATVSAERLRRHRQSLDAVYEAGKILSGPGDPIRTLQPVLNILDSFADLRMGAVALLVSPDDAPSARVNPYVIAATTFGDPALPPSSDAIPEQVASTVLRTGVSMVVQDMAQELGLHPPRSLDDGASAPGRFALLAAPIAENGSSPRTVGVLAAYREMLEDELPPLDDDLRLLVMVANLMAQSLRFRRMVARDRERLQGEAAMRAKTAGADLADAGTKRSPISKKKDGSSDVIGESPMIRSVVERIRKVAPTRSTILLRGESGTGKELFARSVHELSDRRDRPFVKVNCAALSESLLESELFGHEKGSFTGATAQKKGRFELADGGTLFLDEIGEISPSFQSKLLRALQEGEFERVGGARTIKVDVRLVAATNKDLEDAVAKGEFRADLYFRICVIPIVLPPLRERPEDIPRLAEAFLQRFNAENGARLRFAPDTIHELSRCHFPGNVRELENCVNRMAALSRGPVIEASELACQQDSCLSHQLWRLQEANAAPTGGLAKSRLALPVLNGGPQPPAPASCPKARAPEGAQSERDRLVDAMEKTGWVQAKAARILGLTPRQIGYALKKHGIALKKF